jgi:hypothetical protein
MVDFPALLRRFAQAVVANDGEALKAAHGYAPAFYDDGFKREEMLSFRCP